MTQDTRALRDYECLKKYGGCGLEFRDMKAAHAVHQTVCPYCSMDGLEKQWDPGLSKHVYRIQIIHPDGPPRFTPDISGQDGRTNEPVDMSHTLSGNQQISSRSTMDDALKRARDESYESTRGEHSRMEPFREDPNDPESPIHWEKTTSVHEGFDPGVLHPVETIKETANAPMSSFDPGKTAEEVDKDLEKKVGGEDEGLENVPWEHVQKVSDEMYERASRR
jgi:hypothetical protein